MDTAEKFKKLKFLNGDLSHTHMDHYDYLHTAEWKALRLRRLITDNFRCQKCGTGIDVHVHHLRYPKNTWNTESIDDLITLCAACHTLAHETDIANKDIRMEDVE